jgi:hypothetical protein
MSGTPYDEVPHVWQGLRGGTFGRVARDDSAGGAGSGRAALEGVPFVLGQSAPDPGVLAGLGGPFQAGASDLAASADGLCFFDLETRGAGGSDREEKLGTLVRAGSTVAPSGQQDGLLESRAWQSGSVSQFRRRIGQLHF